MDNTTIGRTGSYTFTTPATIPAWQLDNLENERAILIQRILYLQKVLQANGRCQRRTFKEVKD